MDIDHHKFHHSKIAAMAFFAFGLVSVFFAIISFLRADIKGSITFPPISFFSLLTSFFLLKEIPVEATSFYIVLCGVKFWWADIEDVLIMRGKHRFIMGFSIKGSSAPKYKLSPWQRFRLRQAGNLPHFVFSAILSDNDKKMLESIIRQNVPDAKNAEDIPSIDIEEIEKSVKEYTDRE